MSKLKDMLERARPHFEDGGKLAPMKPVYDAMSTFMFAAPALAKNAPFGRDALDVKRYMFMVVIAVFPTYVASIYLFGWRILLLLLVSYAAGGAVEVLFAVIRREEINEGFLVTGYLFPLILPPLVPLWTVAVGIIFGVVVGKEVFGGTGRNLFNPALVGRVFLALGYPSLMTSGWVDPAAPTADATTAATPLVLAKAGELTAPMDLFLGNVLGSAGETSAVAILIGGALLIATGIASWRTILATTASFAVLTAILHGALPEQVAPVLFSLLAGGFLFGAFFMATDPVSGPVTVGGKWFYGILIGSVTVLIRSFSGFVEGMMFAILLGNIAAPLIDEAIVRSRAKRYAHGQ